MTAKEFSTDNKYLLVTHTNAYTWQTLRNDMYLGAGGTDDDGVALKGVGYGSTQLQSVTQLVSAYLDHYGGGKFKKPFAPDEVVGTIVKEAAAKLPAGVIS